MEGDAGNQVGIKDGHMGFGTDHQGVIGQDILIDQIKKGVLHLDKFRRVAR